MYVSFQKLCGFGTVINLCSTLKQVSDLGFCQRPQVLFQLKKVKGFLLINGKTYAETSMIEI